MIHLVPFISVRTPYLSHLSYFTALVSVSRMQNHLARMMSARSWLRRPSKAITSVKKSCLMSISFGKLVPAQIAISFPLYVKIAGVFFTWRWKMVYLSSVNIENGGLASPPLSCLHFLSTNSKLSRYRETLGSKKISKWNLETQYKPQCSHTSKRSTSCQDRVWSLKSKVRWGGSRIRIKD